MQGLGTMLCALVLVTVTRTLGERYDLQWRLALLLGAAPMAVSFFFRYEWYTVGLLWFVLAATN